MVRRISLWLAVIFVPVILLVIVIICGAIGGSYQNTVFMCMLQSQSQSIGTGTATNLSIEVEGYREAVQQAADTAGIGEYTDLLLAIMMQESGGRSADLFQCSESLGKSPNSITQEESIRQAVTLICRYISSCQVQSPGDEPGIRLLLQSYNFGSGYTAYAMNSDGGWTQDNTDTFAKLKSRGKKRTGRTAEICGIWAYGDQYYTNHVFRYYDIQNGSNFYFSGITDAGLAGTIEKSKRLNYLFPSGIPKSNEAMQAYLTTITVPINDKNGNPTTMKITCHKLLANDILGAFEDMQQIGFRIIASETACQNWRAMSSNPNKLSYHSYGSCIDINWNHNPYTSVPGQGYAPYSDPYAITPEVVAIWKSHGFYWGGDWTSSKDYMHMTYTGN